MKSRHDKQDLLERLLKDNGGTGLASHIEHKKKIQASFIKLQWGYQTPKVFNSVAETFLQGVMAFPKDEKLGNEYSYQYFTEPSSSSSSNSVSSGNWHALKRDYFRLKKQSIKNANTTFEIIVAHRNIIGHCIELLTKIQPDKSIAFNTSVTHIIVNQTNVIVDYAYRHDFIPIDLLTMWEVYLPVGKYQIDEHKHAHITVNGVKGAQRKGCCVRLLISCFR
ncbi:unnamed protein product [Rotaria magnacalcarata]